MRVQSHQSLSFRHCSMIFVEIMRLFIEIHSIRTNELTRNQISLYRKLRPRQSALLEIKSADRNFQMHINDLEFNQMCFACATFLIALCTVHSCRLWWAVPFRLRKFELFTPSVVLRPSLSGTLSLRHFWCSHISRLHWSGAGLESTCCVYYDEIRVHALNRRL
jgi:hypothetical protein